MNSTSFLSTHKMYFSTLGKVHIGTGHDLDPTQYVIDGNQLYKFPVDGLIASFSEADRRQLQQCVSDRGSSSMLRQVQRLIHERRAELKKHAYSPIPVSSGVAELYREKMKSRAGTYNALEIRRMYRHLSTGSPILPGSSIKGSIRTALLHQRNQDRLLSRRQESHRELEQRLFQYRNYHQDPMRLVQVGDAEVTDKLPKTSVVFAVNRKKKEVDLGGREARSLAEKGGLYQMLEVVSDRQPRGFRGSLVLQRTETDSTDLNSFCKSIPSSEMHFTTEAIASACNEFYLPMLKNELHLLRHRGFASKRWYKDAETYRNVAEKHDKSFLLRLGLHSGAEAVTIGGVRQIAINQGRRRQRRIGKASESLWLAASRQDDRTQLIPFGWVLVSFE